MKIFPSEELSKKAHIKSFEEYKEMYKYSTENFEQFWSEKAIENLTFFKDFDTVLTQKNYPECKWFEGGQINISYECIDKHLEEKAEQVALIFVGERGEDIKVTYKELSKQVNKSANLLKSLGIAKGDRVIFYMPQILESIYLMLACLRIGAVHSVVFGGFSAESLKDRIEDAQAKLVITADGAFRKGKPYMLKNIVDKAIDLSYFKPQNTLVVRRNFENIDIRENDVIYNLEIDKQSENCEVEKLESEDTSFILYTSGSTGKPKGIIHSTAGYALWAKMTTNLTFDMHADDIFWSTADIGWITGHTYTVYGPLMNGVTTVIYEGNPLFPKEDRVWEIIEKYKVNKFYTAPTLIRLLYKTGKDLPKNFDLSSLEVLGTVGEPINSDAWNWYYETVGNKKASIVDTYWQTETGGHILTPLPGATPMKPRSATFPLPGIFGEVVDENGNPVKNGETGYFAITKPWPSMLRGVWGDKKRFIDTYFSFIKKDGKGLYFSGDGAYKDEEGYIFITGRVDDVLNVSGHKVGVAETESVIAKHRRVAEVSVVGKEDNITGESIFAYIVLKDSNLESEDLLKEINQILRVEIGPVIQVKDILIVSNLPKTRSGKIMRRILRSLARGEEIKGDLTTIEDPKIIDEIKGKLKK